MSSSGKAPPRALSQLLGQLETEGKQIVRDVIGTSQYEVFKISDWVDTITHKLMDCLQERSSDYKYIVTVCVVENKNGGLHMFSTCYWDFERDGTVTLRYDTDTMYVIATIFAVSLDA